MDTEYKNLPSIFEMEEHSKRFWHNKASEQAYRTSEKRNMALILPPIRALGVCNIAADSVDYPKLQSIREITERNMAADLEERNMAADFGSVDYPKLSIESLKELANAAKFGFISYENLPSSSFQAGSSLIESLRSSQASCHDMIGVRAGLNESNGTSAVDDSGRNDSEPTVNGMSTNLPPLLAARVLELHPQAGSSLIESPDRKRKLDDTAAKKERQLASQRKYYIAHKESKKTYQKTYQAEHQCPHVKRKSRCAACNGTVI
jgi:hypothetical protein